MTAHRGVFEKVPGSGEWWVRFADGSGRIRREKCGAKSAAIQLYFKRKNQIREHPKLPENLRTVVRISDIAPAIEKDYKATNRSPMTRSSVVYVSTFSPSLG